VKTKQFVFCRLAQYVKESLNCLKKSVMFSKQNIPSCGIKNALHAFHGIVYNIVALVTPFLDGICTTQNVLLNASGTS